MNIIVTLALAVHSIYLVLTEEASVVYVEKEVEMEGVVRPTHMLK